MWQIIRSVLQRRRPPKVVEHLCINSVVLSVKSLDIVFSEYYENLISPNNKGRCGYVGLVNKRFMCLDPPLGVEVISVFRELNNSSSCDVNDLQTRHINCVTDVLISGRKLQKLLCD